MITIEQAKKIRPGTTLYSATRIDSRGRPMKVRTNGKPKTWKRQPFRVEIPYKYGLYEYGYIFARDLRDLCFTEEEARQGPVPGITKDEWDANWDEFTKG